MSAGFGAERAKNGKAVVIINDDEVTKLLKKYKKLKKYRNSSLYKIKTMDGTETIISSLLDELEVGLDDGQTLST
jgi:hypothetical protein